jgi:hypothetical protein
MSNYSNKHLHLVSLDVPYPPDYGGMIDVFYKIKALHALGIKIHLHCFEYGRGEHKILENYCHKVYYYPRKSGIKGLSLCHPYMQYSRRDKQLLQNLIDFDAPILLEGVHTTIYLNHPALKERKIILRNQNVETEYFKQLQYRTHNKFEKVYYFIEAILLKKLESNLHRVNAFMTVSEADYWHFKQLYPKHQHYYIPSFTEPYNAELILTGVGQYVLYHGNLGHPENNEAAHYILDFIVSQTPQVQYIFAGKTPNQSLIDKTAKYKNVKVIDNPSQEKMDDIIAQAHIHLLITFQATGLKLKLLTAIKKGRFVIANAAMLKGSNLNDVCIDANTTNEIITAIQQYIHTPFTERDISKRTEHIKKFYAQDDHAKTIASVAFN